MRIAAYCRVSTDREEQLDSLENQKRFFREYAEKCGHELTALYADEGISGRALRNRREFLRMLGDADRGCFDMIVVKDISRFARNTVDALTAVRHLRSLGIEVTFLSNSMTILGQSEFVLTVFSALAQEESANLSKRVKFGKRVTAEQGRTPNVIYGYDHIDNLHLSVNEAEASVVRAIFQRYADGLGCRRIARELNDRGIPTKKGASWDAKGVRRILGNSIYCGEYVNRKYEVGDFLEGRLLPLPASDHLHHQRPEWSIVSRELFDRVQEQIALRRPGEKTRYSGRYLFSTLIRCAHCGRAFCRHSYTYARTRIYWQCPANRQDGRCPNHVTVDESALTECIQEHLRQRIGDWEAFVGELLAEICGAATEEPGHGEAAEKKRERLQRQRERLQSLYLEEVITLQELRERDLPLYTELQRLCARPAETEQPSQGAAESGEEPGEEIRRFLQLETMSNGELRGLLERVVIDSGGNTEITFKDLRP